ncbi:hypothetical protein [Afifella pfennigii]|uniref:hypothetical protein n=1 Tax=Afifella pfennigii TaxID=209897 RepID=UPI00068D1D43|nr:hypothetical protein [Afifella pfennigii]
MADDARHEMRARKAAGARQLAGRFLAGLTAGLFLIAAPALAQETTAPLEEEPAAQAQTAPAAPPAEEAIEAPAETPPETPAGAAEADGAAQPAETPAAAESEAEPPQAPAGEAEAEPAETDAPAQSAETEEAAETAEEVPEYLDIKRSAEEMPEPVRRTWRALRAAASSGDIEQLRPLIEAQQTPPAFAFDKVGDPVEYLKALSGDAEGREILAILLEVLDAGFLHVDRGTPNEMYLWPYYARYPLDRLSPEQIVELFTLITAGDWQDIQSYGAYIFFRLGIDPDGRWHFFLAGD